MFIEFFGLIVAIDIALFLAYLTTDGILSRGATDEQKRTFRPIAFTIIFITLVVLYFCTTIVAFRAMVYSLELSENTLSSFALQEYPFSPSEVFAIFIALYLSYKTSTYIKNIASKKITRIKGRPKQMLLSIIFILSIIPLIFIFTQLIYAIITVFLIIIFTIVFSFIIMLLPK